MSEKIGSIETISLIIIVMLNHIILSYPKDIIASTSSASLLNILFISILALLFVTFVVNVLNKFPGYNIIKISEFVGGKTLKYITGFLFLLYFLIVSGITMRGFCENLKIIYFQNFDIIFIVGLFTLAIIACNFLGFNSIIRGNIIATLLLSISIFVIFIAKLGNFNYSRIYPLLGNGFDVTFLSGISNIYAFSAVSIIYFSPSFLKNNFDIKKISYISIIIASILLLLSVASVMFTFPPTEESEQLLPLYLVSRTINFGRFLKKAYAIFLLVWIISMISCYSFAFALVNYIFKELTHISNEKMMIFPFGLVILGISLTPESLTQIRFFEANFYKYGILLFVFVYCFFILLAGYIKNIYFKNKGVTS